MNKKTIVTISRQYGSGGEKVGQILAEKMGVWCYGRDILTIAAEKIRDEELSDEIIEQLNYKWGGIAESGITGVLGMGNIPVYNQMFLEQAKIIQKLANYGSAVFMGRCADYILKDFENCYSIYIYADDEFRKDRVMNVYHEKPEKMEKEDRSRAEYYSYYTGQKMGDLKNYTLAINTSKVDFEKAAELIWKLIQ